MAVNLLLDTSILVKLLNILEADRNLHKLSVWLKLQEIQLYTPDMLLQEWEDRKQKKLQQITTHLNNIRKQHKINKAFPSFQLDPPEVDIANIRIKEQIDIIDGWLKSGIRFSEGQASVNARKHQQAQSGFLPSP